MEGVRGERMRGRGVRGNEGRWGVSDVCVQATE